MSSCLKDRYGNISSADLNAASLVLSYPNIATSNYFYPYSPCRMFCHCCMRRAELAYPDNPGFRLRVTPQEWKQVVAPLVADLNSTGSWCSFLRSMASPCVYICATTRGDWQEPNPIMELNAFYKFISKSNERFFNPRNMEVRLLVVRPPAVGRTQAYQDHKIYLAIHMFNDIEEIRAMPPPVVGVTPGYPRDGEQVYCLWSSCPGLCCIPTLNYRIRPQDPAYVPAVYVSNIEIATTAADGGYGKSTAYASAVSMPVATAPVASLYKSYD